jgi:hypothetical protein
MQFYLKNIYFDKIFYWFPDFNQNYTFEKILLSHNLSNKLYALKVSSQNLIFMLYFEAYVV